MSGIIVSRCVVARIEAVFLPFVLVPGQIGFEVLFSMQFCRFNNALLFAHALIGESNSHEGQGNQSKLDEKLTSMTYFVRIELDFSYRKFHLYSCFKSLPSHFAEVNDENSGLVRYLYADSRFHYLVPLEHAQCKNLGTRVSGLSIFIQL